MTNLTSPQIQFVIENREIKSINEMSLELQLTPYRIRKYMIENKLMPDSETVQRIRVKNRNHNIVEKKAESIDTYEPEKWIPDPWNHSLNPVTFFRVQLLKN